MLIYCLKPVILPIVSEVSLNLGVEGFGEGLITCKLPHESDPVQELRGLVNFAHFGLIVGDNFNELTDDVGEKGDSTKHQGDGENNFRVVLGHKVSVTDG